MNSHSSTPFKPVSLEAKTCFNVSSFSELLPCNKIIGCNLSMASALMPFSANSLFTFSRPILSSLSIATVMSTILSASLIISAIPVRIFRLFILIQTRIPKRVNTSSTICISSTSLRSESLPTTSASHW